MSACPNWSRLVSERDDFPGGEDAFPAWHEALSHLDHCPTCRRSAVAADPLLAFRQMTAFELSPEQEQAEIEDTRRVVAAFRTGQRLVSSEARAEAKHLRRWMTAACLALAMLALGTGRLARPSTPATHATQGGSHPAYAVAPAFVNEPVLTGFEGVNRPKARVYQLRGDHLSVVMIVDDKLNV